MTTQPARTLADMTPEERDQCRGMWCDTPKYPEVILLKPMFDEALGWSLLIPGEGKKVDYPHAAITPRFDLPRAWTPAGDPVPGEWADGHMWWGEDADTMQTVDLVGAECLTTGQVQGLGEWPEGVTPGEDVPVRRFVTDWEEA